jgi:CubicO group peptidase (beta-lactamase class C family)
MRVFLSICLLSLLWLSSLKDAAGLKSQATAPDSSLEFKAAAEAAQDLPRLHSLLVSRHGSLVLERYFNGANARRPANLKSASKSVISALVGIAVGRRLIPGVDTSIDRYFADILQTLPAAKRAITIEDLLTMRSGLQSTSNRNYGAWVLSSNWVRHVLTRPLLSEPGTVMDYSTGNTHLLSAILAKATGMSTWQFAQNALAKPLGFSLPQWPRDPQGIYFGGNEMLMTPRQMLAFGEMYLRKGVRTGSRSFLLNGSRPRSCRGEAPCVVWKMGGSTDTAGGCALMPATRLTTRGAMAGSTFTSCRISTWWWLLPRHRLPATRGAPTDERSTTSSRTSSSATRNWRLSLKHRARLMNATSKAFEH